MAGEVLSVTGPLTLDQADASTIWLDKFPKGNDGVLEVDLSGVTEVDSSAVLVLVRLQRRSEVNDTKVTFTHMPEKLSKLLDFYGLADIINQRQSN